MSVAMYPGEIEVALTPFGASSRLILRTTEVSAAFVAP
jgi:hypothetical protein